jgi:DNA-binding NarL/FixJ family response regulator
MIRIFVIDDHPIVTDGLRYLIHPEQDQMTIVGSALNVHDAIHNLKLNEFDIFILDLYIPNSNPPDNVRMLKNRFREKKIIIFTSESSCIWARAMLKEGVNAYLTKDLSDFEFKSAINKVFNGETVYPINILSKPIAFGEDDPKGETILLPIQREMIQLLCKGLTVKQIADMEGINSFRANYILKKIRQQFKVKNNVELIAELLKRKN